MMKKKRIIISTGSEIELKNIKDKLDAMGVEIIEMRYDIVWCRYDVYVEVNLKQAYALLAFTAHHNSFIRKGEL